MKGSKNNNYESGNGIEKKEGKSTGNVGNLGKYGQQDQQDKHDSKQQWPTKTGSGEHDSSKSGGSNGERPEHRKEERRS